MPPAWFTLVLTRLLSCLRPSQVHGIPFPNSPKSFPVLAKDPALRLSKDPALRLSKDPALSPSNHIPAEAGTHRHPTIPPLPALMVSPSNHTPFTQASRARHPSESVATPRPRPLHPPKRQFTQVPIAPQTRQKSAPLQLKSFLEKTLTARETPNSPPPKAARSQTPHHSGSASSSLARWERVGVRVFRSKRCPAAPAGASTPIRRRPTVPNPAHLAATTGDNRLADPLPGRTR